MIKKCACCGKEFDDLGFTSSKFCGISCAMERLFGWLKRSAKTQAEVDAPVPHAHNFVDLTGADIGELHVLSYAGKDKNRHVLWKCRCSCGEVKIISSTALRSGQQSCGCKGSRTTLGERRTTHGESATRLYRIWKNMKDRCFNPNRERYKDYGGRGITMCDEWKNDYAAFAEWAKSHGYRDDLTIDRIDVDGNYEPGNCRWIPMAEQAANRRPRTHRKPAKKRSKTGVSNGTRQGNRAWKRKTKAIPWFEVHRRHLQKPRWLSMVRRKPKT